MAAPLFLQKRQLVLAVDGPIADDLARRCRESILNNYLEIVTCIEPTRKEADSYALRKLLENPANRLWMLIADENMSGGESGVSFAMQILRNGYRTFSPDAECVMLTGTFKSIGQVVELLAPDGRGKYFCKANDGDALLDKVFAHILERFSKWQNVSLPVNVVEKPVDPIEALEAELASMTESERAAFWLRDVVRQEINHSGTRGAHTENVVHPGVGPLRYKLTDEITALAEQLGVDPDRDINLEMAAILRRLRGTNKGSRREGE